MQVISAVDSEGKGGSIFGEGKNTEVVKKGQLYCKITGKLNYEWTEL